MALFEPVEYTNGTRTVVATQPDEAAQLEWDGFWKTGAAVPVPDLPPGLPPYLDLDSLEALFVTRLEFHVGPQEPTQKRVGMLWFKPIQ